MTRKWIVGMYKVILQLLYVLQGRRKVWKSGGGVSTSKSVSEALIFESFNPQYDERFFIESPEKYKFRTCCVQILLKCKNKKKQFFHTTGSKLVFFEFNEKSLVILWVNQFKNESFWRRFTCNSNYFFQFE